MTFTSASVSALRKDDLLTVLEDVGHDQPVSNRKPQLIDKIIQLQKNVADGTETVKIQEASSEIQSEQENKRLCNSLLETSLNTLFMKPLMSTVGMKEGSFSEHQVHKSLKTLFDKTKVQDVTPVCIASQPNTLRSLSYD